MPQAKGPFLGQLSPEVSLVDLGTRRPVRLVLRLARCLRRRRPSALFASQQHTILAALFGGWLARTGVPIAIVQHSVFSKLCRQSPRRSVRWLLPVLARLCFRWADQIWAVSDGVRRDLAAATAI